LDGRPGRRVQWRQLRQQRLRRSGLFYLPAELSVRSSCFETPFNFTGHAASYTIGPFLGYRVQLGAVVLGIEGDASYKNNANSVSQTTITNIGGGFSRTDYFTGSIRQGWDSSVRGRVGMLLTPWTLIYGTGGVAFERVSGALAYTGALSLCSSPCVQVGTATTLASFSETRVGATGGAGVEFQLGKSPVGGPWAVRLEYRYTDFGSFSKSFAVNTSCTTCASTSPGATIDLHPSFHTVRVGLGYNF
jgi:outer membrane immunogenic protein